MGFGCLVISPWDGRRDIGRRSDADDLEGVRWRKVVVAVAVCATTPGSRLIRLRLNRLERALLRGLEPGRFGKVLAGDGAVYNAPTPPTFQTGVPATNIGRAFWNWWRLVRCWRWSVDLGLPTST